jgi:hypothetical protein
MITGCATEQLFMKNEMLLERKHSQEFASKIDIDANEDATTYKIVFPKNINWPEITTENNNTAESDCFFINTDTVSSNILNKNDALANFLTGSNNFEELSIKLLQRTNVNNQSRNGLYLLLIIKQKEGSEFLQTASSISFNTSMREIEENTFSLILSADNEISKISSPITCQSTEFDYSLYNNENYININFVQETCEEVYAHSAVDRTLIAPFAIIADVIFTPPLLFHLWLHGM